MAAGRLSGAFAALALAVIALLAFLAWRGQTRAADAEANLPYETAKVLTATLARSPALRVSTLSGHLAVTAADPGFGGLLQSTQKRVMPYTVDYFVDLARVGRASYRWNGAARTMIVELPDVTVAEPNIDEARAKGSAPSGIFVSRGAADRLHRQISARAGAVASAEAVKPENLARARENARQAVRHLTQAPLRAAGLGAVSVSVRFPFERSGAIGEQWDESTPLDTILGVGKAAR